MWLKITIPNAFIGERTLQEDEGKGRESWSRAGVRGPTSSLGLLLELLIAPGSQLL